MPKIVGVAEMAEMLGLTKQRVQQLTQRSDFPEPVYRMTAGNFWLLTDFEEWARRVGRPLTKP